MLEDNLTLAKAINICHSMEATKAQLRVMTTRSETDTVTVHELHNEGKSKAVCPSRFANCRNCGSKHQPRQCPAYGKTCYKCGKLNHFAALCRSTLITRRNAEQVNEVTTDTTSQSDPSVLRVQSLCGRKKRNFVGSKMQSTLQVNGTHTCTFKLDTGAEANILPFDLYKQVCSSLLRPTSTVLCGFGNAVIKPLGSIDVAVYDREGREFLLLFYVTDSIGLPILGEYACDLLNLVKKVDSSDDFVQVVHSLITNLPVTTNKLEKIQQATDADKMLQKVKLYCQTTWPRNQKNVIFSVRPYWNVRDTLYAADGIVFSDQRIVVPQSLQSQMLGLIHESHFGIEKSRSHARELLYWAKMVADIERTIANCELRIKYRNNQQREPMISHDILNERFLKSSNLLTNWQKSADLTKLHSHKKYYYDWANSKSLPPLRKGDAVCYRKNKM